MNAKAVMTATSYTSMVTASLPAATSCYSYRSTSSRMSPATESVSTIRPRPLSLPAPARHGVELAHPALRHSQPIGCLLHRNVGDIIGGGL